MDKCILDQYFHGLILDKVESMRKFFLILKRKKKVLLQLNQEFFFICFSFYVRNLLIPD